MIIGLGRFGLSVLDSLLETDVELMVFDNDINRINEVKNKLQNALCLDATNEETLQKFDLRDFTAAIVTMGENFQNNLLTTVILKKFGVRKVIVRAGTAIEEKILRQVGADIVVFPEVEMGRKLASTLLRKSVEESIPLTDEHSIVHVKVTEVLLGKSLLEADIRKQYHINVFAIQKFYDQENEQTIMPGPEYVFEENDVMMIVGHNDDLDRFVKDIA